MTASVPRADQLRENQTIIVRGRVSFSRLAKHIDGEELAKSVAAARARGSKYPTTKPHTTISLIDAAVVPLNPQQPTPEEIFVNDKIYTVKKGDNAGKRGFSIDDKSPNLPPVFEPIPADEQDGSGSHRQLVLTQDLDSGLDVTLVLATFTQGEYANKGLGLQQVILNEAPRYYGGGGVDNAALSAIGVTISGPVQRVSPSEASAAPQQPLEGGLPQGTVVSDEGFALPGPSAFVSPAPVQQAAPAPAFAAPAAPAAPVAPAAPAASNEIAALQAQLAALQGQPATPQGQSAFDAGDNPWGDTAGPGIGFGG